MANTFVKRCKKWFLVNQFKIALKDSFHVDSEWLRSFSPNFECYFFWKSWVFLLLLCAENFNFFMMIIVILHGFTIATRCGVADNIWHFGADGHAFESRINFFLFFNSKIFYDLIQNYYPKPPCPNDFDIICCRICYKNDADIQISQENSFRGK